MAEQDLKQVMLDAITDADSLERFINGDDTQNVLTRLSAKYPTLQKALKELFENGGIAARFKTLTELQASSLTDGDYALVADDTDDKNGIYIKENGEWVKSKYDPVLAASEYTDYVLDSFLGEPVAEPVTVTTLVNRYVNIGTPQVRLVTIASKDSGRNAIFVDVEGAEKIFVENSVAQPDWFWVFSDANDKYISMTNSTNPNGVFKVPPNAVRAYRTIQLADLGMIESPNLKITKLMRRTISGSVEKVIADEKLLYESQSVNIDFPLFSGYSAQELPAKTEFVIENDAHYTRIDVSKFESLTVQGSSILRIWSWVFENKDGSKTVIPNASGSNNGTFIVPETAAFAYRTIHYNPGGSNVFDDRNSIKIEGNIKKEPVGDAVTKVKDELKHLEQIVDEDDLKYMRDPNHRIYPNDFDGNTQTERMKSAIEFVKFRGFGVIELGYDNIEESNTWAFTESILLPSNCWIYINNVTVKKADGIFDTLFRNEGLVPNPDPYGFALEVNRNDNIRIIGNDPSKSIIEGNQDNPYIAPSHTSQEPVPYLGDYYGWRATTILFANTHDFRVYNVKVRKTNSWAILNEQGCSNFKYHDIIFETYVKNADGINCHMGCHDFELYNLSGITTDDFIGLKSKLNYINKYPSGKYMYPKLAGGYADRGFGTELKNGKIWNIRTSGAFTAALLLYSGGGSIHDISISNVIDTNLNPFRYYAVRIGNNHNHYGAAPKMGDCYNISLYNISSYRNGTLIELVSPLKDSWFANIKRLTSNADPVIAKILNYEGENIKETNISSVP